MNKNSVRNSLIESLFIGLLAAPGAAAAKTAKGPALTVEQDGGTAVGGGDKGTKPTDLAVARRRYEMNLLLPIPAKVLGGMFLVKGDLFKERRDYAGRDAQGGMTVDVRNPNVGGWGLVFLPHAAEGAPKFFAVVERYGYLSTTRKAKPLGEYILGADIADDDMPFHLKFSPSDEAETRVLVRLRRFPGFNKWLLLVGHKIETKSGLSIDGAIPSHLILGWQTDGGDWKVYGGGKAVSREYPMAFDLETQGWIEGFTGYGLLGLRRKVTGPLFGAFEGGVQKEWTDWHDLSGKIFQQFATKAAPFVRLSLETWVQTP